MAEDIGLASAGGAGAVAAEEFEGKVGLAAIIPRDGEFGSDLLNGSGLKRRCHVILGSGFGNVGRLEVDGLGWACLSDSAGKVDCLRGGVGGGHKERGGAENRDSRRELRLGFIGWK